MKLIELGCDQRSFHSISFNSEGLTLIVGDGASEKKKEGSSNGVGKTLALGLVHHCLGANSDPLLKQAVPDWMFRLTFSSHQKEHTIERSGDGKRIYLDGKSVSHKGLRSWLDKAGAFRLEPTIPATTFRALVKRFGRYLREDCIDPLRMAREPDFDARLRSLYLLGLDCSLVLSKKLHKVELDSVKQTLRTWQHDNILQNLFRAGAQPKVRAEWLDREISRIKGDLERFQVAEDYRAIELEAGELTGQLRNYEKQYALIAFQLESIEKALTFHPDISREDLLGLYAGLQQIFRPEALTHFEAVEDFHHSLAAKRKARLEADRVQLLGQRTQVEAVRKDIATKRDQKLQALQGKRALDEYAVLARKLAELQEERGRIEEYLTLSVKLQNRAQTIREERVDEDRVASSYIVSNPLEEADRYFSELANTMYLRAPAGLVLENNTRDNQLRYDLAIQIEGDNSDGINAARILCFDWLLLMKGANHTMNFLWHDNRLFADIDPRARAAWFSHAINALPGTGKQYIATLNTENFDAMKEFLSGEEAATISKAVKLTLRGDAPVNKLLGIQFGSQS